MNVCIVVRKRAFVGFVSAATFLWLLFSGVVPLPAFAVSEASFTDTDGDSYTVRLTGPGTMQVTIQDTGGGQGPIASVALVGTTLKSVLSVQVTAGEHGN